MRHRYVATFFVLTLMAVSFSAYSNAQALNRYAQSVDVQSTFAWNSSFNLPKGKLTMNLNLPLRIAASGLPNKVTPGESFQITTSVGLQTGTILSIGGHQFNLDPLTQFAAPYIPQSIDLSTIGADATCAISYFTTTPAGSTVVCQIANAVKTLVEFDLRSHLILDGHVTGPGSLSNPEVQTWLSKSGSTTLSINTGANRGDQLSLQVDSGWSVNLYLDFRPDIYTNPTYGWAFKDVRDALHLPRQFELGLSRGSSSPKMSSLILIPDFQLLLSLGDVTAITGQSSSVGLSASAIDEYDGAITLSVSQAPAGLQAGLSNTEILPQSTTTITLNPYSIPQGNYQLAITGTGGGKSHTVYLTVHIQTQGPGNYGGTTTAPNDGQVAFILVFIGIVLALFVGLVFLLIRKSPSILQPIQQPIESIRPSIPLTPSPAWFCRYCGREIEFYSRFCCYCGSGLD